MGAAAATKTTTTTGVQTKRSTFAIVLATILGGYVLLQTAGNQSSFAHPFLQDRLSIMRDHSQTRIRQLTASHRLAVARTFCEDDANALAESFDTWDELAPCGHGGAHVDADLFLIYSQVLESSPAAQAAVDSVIQRFQDTNGWNGCFGRITAFGVAIDPEHDTYNPKEQHTNRMWVNGPNRQFERSFREIQSGIWGDYESMYLMEMDSVPVKSFWLDSLVKEVMERHPFAILGSKYRGDKWDSFYSQLPSALLNHINGNAVYNLTHPLLNHIVNELEAEAPTVANAVPYDYRIAQIIEEGRTGNVPDFPKLNALAQLPSKTTTFISWVQEYSFNTNPIQETKLLGNYAATNMLPSFVGEDEVVIHGANMYEPWDNERMGGVTLVVSSWHDSEAKEMLSLLSGAEAYIFSRIAVILPDNIDLELPDINIPIDVHQRGTTPDYMDLCSAPIETEWFMVTNSYHRIKPNTQLMTKRSDTGVSKPVVSYAPANEENCHQFEACARDLDIAKSIFPKADRAFRNDDMVFNSASRNDYCELLQRQKVSGIPSATTYIAHLQKTQQAQAMYKFSDRTINGSRDLFALLPNGSLSHTLSTHDEINTAEQSLASRRLDNSEERQQSSVIEEATLNQTIACTTHVFEDECRNAGCDWNSPFDSCRSSPNGSNQPTETTSGGFAGKSHWEKGLIGAAIAAGCVLAIGFAGITYKRVSASHSSARTYGDAQQIDEDMNEDLSDIVSVGAILRDLEGGPPPSTPGFSTDEILQDLDASTQYNGTVEFTRNSHSGQVVL